IAMYERRSAQGPSRSPAPHRAPGAAGARICHRRNAAHAQQGRVRSSGRHALSRAAPAGGCWTGDEPVVGAERPTQARLPAHGEGPARDGKTAGRVARLRSRCPLRCGGRRMNETVETYLADLARELRKRGLFEPRIVEEARGHLLDAVEAGRHRGLTLEAAVALGIAIAYVDSRPNWDDAGITAGSMLLSAGLMGLIGPQRPWLWALGIGIWIPLHSIARAPTFGSLAGSFLILAFPMAGAYAGMAFRRALASN